MKKIVGILVVFALLTACKNEAKKEVVNEENTVEAVETPLLSMADFHTVAGDYVDKEIQIQGIVDHVCKHGGKKIFLATDDGNVHVNAEERFDEALNGSEILVTGIVVEERIDEAFCLQMEEDNIKSHSEGKSSEEQFEAKKKHIQAYRDEMKEKGVDYLSNFSIKYVSLKEVK